VAAEAVKRVAFDSNILLYARLEPDTVRGRRSQQLLYRAVTAGIVSAQAIGEFLNVARAKAPDFDVSVGLAHTYADYLLTPPTTFQTAIAAAALTRDHKIQFWDAIIITASAEAGASVLLSEDMQDGRAIGGLTVLNPFNPDNDAAIDALLPA
jgi:predicted nucleic acid-binding protein